MPIRELDHIMLAVFDHARAITAFNRLGFCVRPVRQLAPMGGGSAGGNGGSAAILLHGGARAGANYIELARADPNTAMPTMRALLCEHEGPAMLVNLTDDCDDLIADWQRLGFDVQRFRASLRPFGQGRGTDIEIVLPSAGAAPFPINACWYEDSADFKRPEWRTHPNGARSWLGLTLALSADEIANAADRFTRIYGRASVLGDGSVSFRPADNHLTLMTDQIFSQAYGLLGHRSLVHVAVADMTILTGILGATDVPFHVCAGGIVVEARYGVGTALHFSEVA